MQLRLESGTAHYKIRAYTAHYIQVNEQKIEQSFIISPDKVICPWHVDKSTALQMHHLEPIFMWQPSIVLLGTGRRLIFPACELYAVFLRQCIGFEVMNTAAACRTYTALMAEGRKVVAALQLDPL